MRIAPDAIDTLGDCGTHPFVQTPESVKAIKEAFRLLYRSNLNTRQAIEAVRKAVEPREEISQLLEFIEKSERGIIR